MSSIYLSSLSICFNSSESFSGSLRILFAILNSLCSVLRSSSRCFALISSNSQIKALYFFFDNHTSYSSFNLIQSSTSFCVNLIGVSFAPQYSDSTVQDSIPSSCINLNKSSGQPKLPNSVRIIMITSPRFPFFHSYSALPAETMLFKSSFLFVALCNFLCKKNIIEIL